MKILVAYYSLDGHSESIAKELAALLGADIMRIEPLKEIKQTGFAKYFFGGMSAVFKKSVMLKAAPLNAAGYEKIVIGGPIWAGRPAPALRSFFCEAPLNGKAAAVFFCHLSKPGGAFSAAESLLKANGARLIAGEDFCQLKIDEDRSLKTAQSAKLSAFAEKIKNLN